MQAGWVAPFNEMESAGGFDMFCPFGKKRMVLMDGLIDGERNEDDEEADVRQHQLGVPSDEQLPVSSADNIVLDEPDLEDMATEELTRLEASCP